MSRNLRLIFFVLGIVILIGALVALAYAYWPTEIFRQQTTVAPTLFAPP